MLKGGSISPCCACAQRLARRKGILLEALNSKQTRRTLCQTMRMSCRSQTQVCLATACALCLHLDCRLALLQRQN